MMVLVSCAGYIPSKKKLQVYTDITAANDSLETMVRDWHQQLILSTKDKNFSRLRPYRVRIGQFLSEKRASVAGLQTEAKWQGILDNEETFLATQAQLFSDSYAAFELYNNMTPNDVINNQLRIASVNLTNMLAGKASMVHMLQVYARKNDLKLKK